MIEITEKYPKSIQARINNSDWRGAISELIEQYKKEQDSETLVQLRNLRMIAGENLVEMGSRETATPCPPVSADPFPDVKKDIPAVHASELNDDVLAGAMYHHGALIVREFASPQFCEKSRKHIDKAVDAAKRFYSVRPEIRAEMLKKGGGSKAWFSLSSQTEDKSTSSVAFMMAKTGALWTFLSPKATYHLTSFFERKGLRKLLKTYFNDEPCMSFNKSVLRRMAPLENPADWHQDGSFMSADIKSLNLWIALSECGKGTNRPGMDFVPRRFREVVETGTNGASFNWSVSHDSVHEKFEDTPPVRPYFAEGDAIFFDHFNLHVTSFDESFDEPRYAIENWFFAQKHNAGNQTPAYW